MALNGFLIKFENITYLILWEKLALNGVRMVKIALGGGKFVF